MKLKSLFLITLIFIPVFSFTQNQDLLLDSISEKFSKQLSKEIFKKFSFLNSTTDSLSINITLLYNQAGEQTQLSKQLGYRIDDYLQNCLNKQIIKKYFYKVSSVYKINQNFDQIKKYDYTLTGKYTITNNGISFTKLRMNKTKASRKIVYDDISISVPNVSILNQLNAQALEKDYFESLMNLNRENTIVKSASLVSNQTPVRVTNIDGVGQVYNCTYNTHYNFNVELAEDAYIYAVFYDPGDKQYHFLWAIDNPNIKHRTGVIKNILQDDFYFYPTKQKAVYNYIKIIASKQRIDIDKYYTKKFIDGKESTIIDKKECKKLLEDLKNMNDIQTINLILTF